MAEREDGWNLVTRKRRRSDEGGSKNLSRMDRAWGRGPRMMDKQVTFYFTRFPDVHGAKEMFCIFSLYGKATEVVIPAKRDKFGRRFGFVRFREVRDSDLFATKLDNIIIGATKIYVNVPRFSKENNARKETRKEDGRNGEMNVKDWEVRVEKEEDRKGKMVMKDEQSHNKNLCGAVMKENNMRPQGRHETYGKGLHFKNRK